jgi:cell wall-associated NlpC family hydrolase
VTGYIQPCSGTGFPVDASTGARLFSAAALVEALPGQEYWKTAADGTYRVVLPAVVASRERVSQNEAFELDDLAPGRYVILAQYTGGNMSTHVNVSVAPGQVVTVDLPDTCK